MKGLKSIFLVLLIVFALVGCEYYLNFPQQTTTTQKNLAQLSEEDWNNIVKQVMDQVRAELLNEYQQGLSDVENMIINVVRAYGETVVGVSNYVRQNNVAILKSTGSGVIYKHIHDTSEYYVITNEHVVDGAQEIRVVLEDGREITAELIGKDAQTDLAVIKFQLTDSLPTAVLGDSDELVRGQFAIAIGNPLGYEYYGSVTFGIVSGLARDIDIDYDGDNVIDWVATLIQHDAAISPGNSGGGLFNIKGELIGINNMKIVESRVDDIGFAIPVNTVKYIIEQLELYGKVERPSLGITGRAVEDILYNNELIRAGVITGEITPIPNGITYGVYVTSLVKNGSAYGYLQEGDIIIKYNGIEIKNFDTLRLQINNAKIGDIATLTIIRNNREMTVSFPLKKRP